MDRSASPSVYATIKDLISYSANAIVGSFLCGTIWYLRVKFRNLIAQISPETSGSLTPRSYRRALVRINQSNSISSSVSSILPEALSIAQEPEEIPIGLHVHPENYLKLDLPPAYNSLAFPSVDAKDDNPEDDDIEFPPTYRSIFIISQSTRTPVPNTCPSHVAKT